MSLKRLSNYYRDTNSATSANAPQAYGRGSIVVYYQIYRQNISDQPTEVALDMFGKLAYTDN